MYNILFGVSDGINESTRETTIVVNNVNRAPSFGKIKNVSVDESIRMTLQLIASDPDAGDILTFNSNVSFGSISGDVFSWTPDYTRSGTYHIAFTVSDGSLSDVKVVTVAVNDVNAPPELTFIGKRNVTEGDELVIVLTATDVDGDTL